MADEDRNPLAGDPEFRKLGGYPFIVDSGKGFQPPFHHAQHCTYLESPGSWIPFRSRRLFFTSFIWEDGNHERHSVSDSPYTIDPGLTSLHHQVSRVRLCFAWQKASNRVDTYAYMADECTDLGYPIEEIRLVREISYQWVLYFQELDRALKILHRYEKQGIFPNFSWRGSITTFNMYSSSNPPTLVSPETNTISAAFLDAVEVVERVYDEGINYHVQAIAQKLLPWQPPAELELYQASIWDEDARAE